MSSLILRLRIMEIAVWVIVVLLGAVVYIVWHGSKFARDQRQSTVAMLSSLGDTHRLGYQGLTLVVQRIEQRVKQLEERRVTSGQGLLTTDRAGGSPRQF
jgi:flagellar basal body-associated protein FliL